MVKIFGPAHINVAVQDDERVIDFYRSQANDSVDSNRAIPGVSGGMRISASVRIRVE